MGPHKITLMLVVYRRINLEKHPERFWKEEAKHTQKKGMGVWAPEAESSEEFLRSYGVAELLVCPRGSGKLEPFPTVLGQDKFHTCAGSRQARLVQKVGPKGKNGPSTEGYARLREAPQHLGSRLLPFSCFTTDLIFRDQKSLWTKKAAGALTLSSTL